jgi:hypothetical protein
MINAIPASQRLSDALCFLAIGQATWRSEIYNFSSATNTEQNSLVLDVPAVTIEPQLNRHCTIFTPDSAVKIDERLSAHYISNSLSVSLVTVQTLNAATIP